MERFFRTIWSALRKEQSGSPLRGHCATPTLAAEVRRFYLSATALLGLSLNAFMLGSILVSPGAFDRVWAWVDSSRVAVLAITLLLLGPVAVSLVVDYRGLQFENWQWAWQKRATRLLLSAGLGYLIADVTVLRGPWILGYAGNHDRIGVWSALLSSAFGGIPLLPFALALGFAATCWCVASGCVRSYRACRPAKSAPHAQFFVSFAWLLCALDIGLGVAAIIAFATGGPV